jgi:hypothetical protein
MFVDGSTDDDSEGYHESESPGVTDGHAAKVARLA